MFRNSIILSFIPLFSSLPAITDRDFRPKTAKLLRVNVIKYFEDGDVLMKRHSDLQLFRISLDIFTEDDQAFVKNNFPPNHDALPKFKKPLDERTLPPLPTRLIKRLNERLKSYRQRPNKRISDEAFLRQSLSKIIGQNPTLKKPMRLCPSVGSKGRKASHR